MQEGKSNDDRRDEFVDAAEKLFKENGIVDTTISSIVKEMDVAKGLFYYYFKSKDDVIDAISDRYNKAFSETMKKSMALRRSSVSLDTLRISPLDQRAAVERLTPVRRAISLSLTPVFSLYSRIRSFSSIRCPLGIC